MKIRFIMLCAFTMMLFSCSSSKKVVQETKVEEPEIELTPELAEGKAVFENECAKCHKLYSPSAYTKEQWQPIMKRMQRKAGLSDAERDLVYNYVTMNK